MKIVWTINSSDGSSQARIGQFYLAVVPRTIETTVWRASFSAFNIHVRSEHLGSPESARAWCEWWLRESMAPFVTVEELEASRAELARERDKHQSCVSATQDVLDQISSACSCPVWEPAEQVIRNVGVVVRERNEALDALAAARAELEELTARREADVAEVGEAVRERTIKECVAAAERVGRETDAGMLGCDYEHDMWARGGVDAADAIVTVLRALATPQPAPSEPPTERGPRRRVVAQWKRVGNRLELSAGAFCVIVYDRADDHPAVEARLFCGMVCLLTFAIRRSGIATCDAYIRNLIAPFGGELVVEPHPTPEELADVYPAEESPR